MLTCNFSRRGFSLLEMAIVLGVVGVIIAGVWTLAATAREKSQLSQANQQINLLLRNTRDYYAARALPSAAVVAATFTGTLRSVSVFPETMCSPACVSGALTVRHAFGAEATVAIPSLTAPINQIGVVLSALTKAQCVGLGSSLTTQSQALGLTQFKVGATTHTSFPVSPTTLNTTCASATSNSVELRFLIRSN
jgi:prepilin-type N-terminal cleavage/methylation domain-containing protein